MGRVRSLTEADREAWADFVHGARPAPASPRPPAPPRRSSRPTAGLDDSAWKRFRNSRLAPQRRLDLHGRTAAAAHSELLGFLHTAHADGIRCVEVITGKGGEAGGVLRRELPLWLDLPPLRPLVLATTQPHARNPGAVRLLLRRPR